MRCIICEKISLKIICRKCQRDYFVPIFNKRELSKDFFVHSFYEYDLLKELLSAKYQFYGDRIYNILGKLAFKKFGEEFEFPLIVDAIGVDDHVRHDFSHTAILTKHLKSHNIVPKYNLLKAQNIIKYAGKSLEFRKNNPRNFKYFGKKKKMVILVDDIVTTGSTLLEAKRCLEQNECEVLFALTLSDARF